MPQKESQLQKEVEELRVRLADAQETLRAIQNGEVDALVVATPKGDQIYTITSAEQPYRLLIEEMKEGAVMLSEDNSILYCNNGFAKMMKCPPEKIIGNYVQNMVAPTHMTDFEELLAKGRTGKGPAPKEITLQAEDDTLVPTQMSINALKMDHIRTTFLVVTDLTQHMRREVKEYTDKLERQAALIDLSPDAIIVRKMDGTITFWNRGAEKLYGYTKHEAKSKKIQALLNTKYPISIKDILKQLELSGRWTGEITHQIKDGHTVTVHSRWQTKTSAAGTKEILVSNVDITERKQMQNKLEEYANQMEQLANERAEKLKAAERLAAIGETAGMVGHDIRNPLQTVTGEVYLARQELETMPDSNAKRNLKESIDLISEQTTYVSKIVADLQDFARPVNPEPKTTSTQQLINDVLSQITIPPNIKITKKLDQNATEITVDPTMMKRALGNLILNAIQAMPEGGKITIKAKKELNYTNITVQDTGPGIPEEIQGKLFQPLFTTKSKGQGFGLPVVKRFVDAHKGQVTFTSEKGKGTAFTIKIPNPKHPDR